MNNRAAFLAMIGACEGADYNTLVGGGTFDNFDGHPRQLIQTRYGASTAAGRYQILARTWDDYIRDVGPRKFDGPGQDECAVWLIRRRGALGDVDAGRLEAAIAKCNKEWASLPGSPYGQKTRTLAFCLDNYAAAGGHLADSEAVQPAAPIEERGTEAPVAKDDSPFASLLDLAGPVATIFNPIAGALISAFTPLAKEKLTKEINRHTDNPQIGAQVADGVIGAAQRLTGLLDPVDAVSAARKDPAVLAQIEADALARVDKLTEIADKLATYDKDRWSAEMDGKNSAAMRAAHERWDMTKTVVLFAGATTAVMVLVLLAAVVWPVVAHGSDPNNSLLALAGPLFMASIACWKDVFAYRFDGNKDSSAKDALIAQMVKR